MSQFTHQVHGQQYLQSTPCHVPHRRWYRKTAVGVLLIVTITGMLLVPPETLQLYTARFRAYVGWSMPTRTYVEDRQGNRCTIAHFGSYEAAMAALVGLTNCEKCVDCVDCRHCVGCRGCEQCYNCKLCIDCLKCADCSWCEVCYRTNDCTHCDSCFDCHACKGCNRCDRLIGGEDESRKHDVDRRPAPPTTRVTPTATVAPAERTTLTEADRAESASNTYLSASRRQVPASAFAGAAGVYGSLRELRKRSTRLQQDTQDETWSAEDMALFTLIDAGLQKVPAAAFAGVAGVHSNLLQLDQRLQRLHRAAQAKRTQQTDKRPLPPTGPPPK